MGDLHTHSTWLKSLLPAALLLAGAGAIAQPLDEDELALSYGDNTQVSIATGSAQAVSHAPATATVITAREIKAMGATDLDQVLESVPGLHVSVSHLAYAPIYSLRGSFTNFNPQVLMLVNGLPITNIFAGNRSFAWGGMPVENIARVEVIRGPGSALYGADAYAGVINVITKRAADIDGLEAGARVGSFKSRDAWLQYGGRLGALSAAFYLRAGSSDGARRIIEEDSQTRLDAIFGTSASLAPGPLNVGREAIDVRADLAYGKWRWRSAYQKRDVGVGAGVAESVDPFGRIPETRFYTDLSYEHAGVLPHWDASVVLGYYDLREAPGEPAFRLFPAGAFGGAFPDGVIGNPGHYERNTSLTASAVYTGLARHRVRIGVGHRIADLYGAPEFKNFNLVVVPGVGPVFEPLGSVVDATHVPELGYLTPHKRRLSYVFLQDEWALAPDWSLTSGVRHDAYSDFGSTTNPRLALVWDAAFNVVVKAMHGRAFRAPALTEQYTINNPVNIGNPAIRPETIATSELAFLWKAADSVQTGLTLYRHRMRDIIAATANPDPSTGKTFRNTADQSGRGFELEGQWDAGRAVRVSGSWSVQHSLDEMTGKDPGLAPRQRLFARADWRPSPEWELGGTLNHVADRRREPDDTRPQLADYTTLDMSLRRLAGAWELRATVLNLFNRDVREPSLAPGNIRYDLPMPKRSLSFEITRRL
ncbi:TonB-dependent receptor [Massilia glaciei]|uniref:TonB-dependent receptor n=1 Tax=Massilia glaciei TaxID=1524097 RepID=A0A2U2I6G0_9BURK|nr:TonB-dependent receptor [Massilia glaciei]